MSAWRYIAQRATSREFLDLDLPLSRDELSWALSGAGALRGSVSPDLGRLRADDGSLLLEEWGTLLFAEADGEIRWGGILISSAFEGAKWSIEAAGFSTYPHGIPWTAPLYSKIDTDPADIVRDVWAHLQGQPDGDLGVIVEGATSVRIGEEARQVEFTTGAGESVSFEAGPYHLDPDDAPDLGDEIDSLAKETPFDFVEEHRWNGEDIDHVIRLGYPRHGRRRTDLAFIQGDNVTDVVPVTASGDEFANVIMGLGAGEGTHAVRRSTGVRDGRLRRPFVLADKSITTERRMDTVIAAELRRRQLLLEIASITVRDHPNAPIGSWALGDDIEVRAEIPWLGEVALWCRVVGWSLVSDSTATLTLKRSDAFTYGG